MLKWDSTVCEISANCLFHPCIFRERVIGLKNTETHVQFRVFTGRSITGGWGRGEWGVDRANERTREIQRTTVGGRHRKLSVFE